MGSTAFGIQYNEKAVVLHRVCILEAKQQRNQWFYSVFRWAMGVGDGHRRGKFHALRAAVGGKGGKKTIFNDTQANRVMLRI